MGAPDEYRRFHLDAVIAVVESASATKRRTACLSYSRVSINLSGVLGNDYIVSMTIEGEARRGDE